MNDHGLHLTRGTDLHALADGLVAHLFAPGGDPFAQPLVLVPGSGMRRWLSQRIATAEIGGEGICAGVRFEDVGRLAELLGGPDPADDPWASGRLVWRILEVVEAGTPGLEPLARHLEATEQRYANASRIAGLISRYARLRPELLAAWSQAPDPESLGLGFDTWQPILWRALRSHLGPPDPVERRQRLLAAVGAGRAGVDAPTVAVFCPRQLTKPDAELLGALAQARPVHAWLRVSGPPGTSHPLGLRLGRRGAETAALLESVAATVTDAVGAARPATWLGSLQSDLEAGRPPARRELEASDRTLDVHASHGLGRQVEVLREVLAGLFADDASLEPRHVLVACPDPTALAPHLSAAFAADPLTDPHPGATFRVQIAHQAASEVNQLYTLVRDVAQLGATRATAGQLLNLATHPFVARRFGISADDGERLSELVPAASVRWGLNDAHRREFGLDQVRQGTWQVGVQRLLLGEALSEDQLASAGVIAPVDDVESSDVELLGALAELVSRVSRLARRAERATPAAWAAHFRAIVDMLVDVPFDDSWQLAQVWSVLDLIERRSGDSPALLGPSDALALLDAEFEGRTARPAFGNGSLVVCGLAALAQVPHRVVCLVGLDERSFPRRGIADGDDLAAAAPLPGEPDPGSDDRQAILDALGAAQERLVVIYQGWSGHTREPRPAPSGLVDVIEVAAATRGVPPAEIVIDEPLQPFSPSYFVAPPRSFDQASLAAARALVGPRAAPRERYSVGYLPEPTPPALEMDSVRAFLAHPAKYFLRERAGLTLGEDDPPSDALPLELDALDTWKVGDRLLGRLLRGDDFEAARHAEWLRGELPPGNLGGRVLEQASAQALRVAREAGPFLEEPLSVHTIDLELEGIRLTGRAASRSSAVLTCQYGRIKPRTMTEAWLDALALTVTLGRGVDALLFGGGKRARLTAPEPEVARALLCDLVMLAAEGRRTVLPMPPRVTRRWAECRARNTDPLADHGLKRLWNWDRDPSWDAVWPDGVKPWETRIDGEPWARRGEPTKLGSLADIVWRPIVRAER